MKLITFPEVLYDTQNWLFDMNSYTAEKNSDNSTGTGAPSTNKFQVEKGKDYITTTGIAVSKSESNGLRMIFTQSISCLLYTSPSPRDMRRSRMPSSA